jgi:hypothetical protein
MSRHSDSMITRVRLGWSGEIRRCRQLALTCCARPPANNPLLEVDLSYCGGDEVPQVGPMRTTRIQSLDLSRGRDRCRASQPKAAGAFMSRCRKRKVAPSEDIANWDAVHCDRLLNALGDIP